MKFVPHDYQRYCEEKIIETPNIALFLDMGLGKTVITLTAIYKLKYHRFALRRALVVAPKKVAACKEKVKPQMGLAARKFGRRCGERSAAQISHHKVPA